MISEARQLLYSGVCCLFLFWGEQVRADSPDLGFLYDDFPLTLDEGHRTEVAGPLFFHEQAESQDQWSMPPLWSWTTDPVTDVDEFDFLYPVVTWDRFGSEHRFQIFQLFAIAGGKNEAESHQKRFTLFPIYFQQRSPDPKLNYTALVPIYGHLQNRLFRDRIKFILFPLYGQSIKRDIVTDNYLFPVFHLRHGNELHGWQAWPVVGHEHKEPTYFTNTVDVVETIGGHDKWFGPWPIYFNTWTGLGTTNPAHEVSFLPAYSQLRSPNRDSTTVGWPFFTHVTDREKQYREWELPWPIIIFARGEGKTANRVWPLFSRVHDNQGRASSFYLWPVYKDNRVHTDLMDRDRWRILLYLYSDMNQTNIPTGKSVRRVDEWPLFTYHRDYNGDRRLQIIAPIEPIIPNNKSIERDWSPLWSFWRSEAKGDGSATSQSLLWNLFRHETGPDREKCSLLFGLFHYQSDAESWRYQVGYIPVAWGTRAGAAQAKNVPVFQPVPEDTTAATGALEQSGLSAADAVEMTGNETQVK